MRSMGMMALATLVLVGGHLEQAGAGGKWWKKRNCGGCSAPVMAGCYAPSGCAGPYSFGCSGPGCFAPSCSTPYGCSGCSQPAFYAPSCAGGCAGVYGCATSGYNCGTPAYGCAYGGARPEYAPYVYQPNPYVNTWGVGAPVSAPGSNVWTIGAQSNGAYSNGASPLMSAYNAPVGASMPSIPPLPPAEDVHW